ncbi:MAG: CRISPR-associated protein Cas4 [Burkholderiales bacterium]|jgi:CRISPR-associated exonuclease Cas4|nr:CRISPR-associated protein Cas4 [Burkholderiales bacterium]
MFTDDPIPLSALQHYLYCPRQCALIHLEQIWIENRFTAEGRVLHDRVDIVRTERQRGVRTVSAMPVADLTLGIAGIVDVVEFHETPDGKCAYPVEYKRGRPKAHRADEVQLCAQALCLETMLRQSVPEGSLFYGKTRRRKIVIFDEALRALTHETIRAIQDIFVTKQMPGVKYDPSRCNACSLIESCQPQLLNRRQSVDAWLRQEFIEEEGDAPPA